MPGGASPRWLLAGRPGVSPLRRSAWHRLSHAPAAYLVAGLQRAATNNGMGPAALSTLADQHLRDWTAWAEHDDEGRWIAYEVTLYVPVLPNGEVSLALRGRVRNVRPRRDRPDEVGAAISGGRAATAEAVFSKGVPVDALVTDSLGRRGLLVHHLMPWLVEHGVTARGAKCALVDHPLPVVPQVVYAELTGSALPQLAAYSVGWRRHVARTYLDANLQWGNAACPDDISLALLLVESLGQPNAYMRGVGWDIAAVARHCGRTPDDLRELAVPPNAGAWASTGPSSWPTRTAARPGSASSPARTAADAAGATSWPCYRRSQRAATACSAALAGEHRT